MELKICYLPNFKQLNYFQVFLSRFGASGRKLFFSRFSELVYYTRKLRQLKICMKSKAGSNFAF